MTINFPHTELVLNSNIQLNCIDLEMINFDSFWWFPLHENGRCHQKYKKNFPCFKIVFDDVISELCLFCIGVSWYPICVSCFSYLDLNEFLDVIIEQQGDSRDVYDEILQGFKMFDYGKAFGCVIQ